MKIAFLSFYSGEVFRGVETYVHELANRLTKLGHEIVVYQNGKPLNDRKYQTVSLGIKWSTNPPIKEFTKEVLKKIDAQTNIIIPTNGGWQSLLCKFWAVKNKKKIIISGQAGPGADEKFNLYTFPDVFVGISTSQAEWAKKVNPAIRMVKIPNGTDLKRFSKNGDKAKIDLPHPIILSVGAFVPMKRLDLAIKAVAELSKGSLLIVGSGTPDKQFLDLANSKLPGRYLIKSVNYLEMPNIYRSADLFTFPTSTWESFGIAMVEAMASGLPVVATDDPIRREIVRNAGLFVNPKNTNEYTKVLERALKKEWGNAPRKQAEKFSWDEIAVQYDNLFKSLK